MLNIQPTKEEEHVAKLLTRIRDAKELGQVKKLRHWTGAYLNSFHAKLAAVQRANRCRKPGDRLVGRSGELDGDTSEIKSSR